MSTALTDEDFARAAKELNVEVAAVRAVAEVEAAGAGFLPDGRPAVLYEAHIFHKHSKGAHANAKDRRGVKLSSLKWNRSLYGKTGAPQHNRYEDARKLDPDAANQACSWGTFQILGQNYKECGFDTSQALSTPRGTAAPRRISTPSSTSSRPRSSTARCERKTGRLSRAATTGRAMRKTPTTRKWRQLTRSGRRKGHDPRPPAADAAPWCAPRRCRRAGYSQQCPQPESLRASGSRSLRTLRASGGIVLISTEN
jgi:hypothetical protein